MRKLFVIIIFLVSIFSYKFVNADGVCPGVNFPADYDACCRDEKDYLYNRNACDAYVDANVKAPYCSSIDSASEYKSCCAARSAYLLNSATCDGYFLKTDPQSQQQGQNGQKILNDICANTKFNSLVDILNVAKCFLRNGILPILFIGVVLFFFISVLKYVSEKDSKKQEEHKKTIVWGLVGIFVMISVWGIVEIISVTLGLGSANPIPLLQTKPYTK